VQIELLYRTIYKPVKSVSETDMIRHSLRISVLDVINVISDVI